MTQILTAQSPFKKTEPVKPILQAKSPSPDRMRSWTMLPTAPKTA
jgi:hypothetical protein